MKSNYFIFLFLFIFNFGYSSIITKPLALSATITGGTTVCQNATNVVVTFTGSGGTAPYTFIYEKDGVGSFSISTTASSSSVPLVVPTSVLGTFEYSLVSVKGSTGSAETVTGSTSFTISAPPIIDFTFDNNTSCSGTLIQFTSTISESGAAIYSWDFGDLTPPSTTVNPTHRFEALGCGNQNFLVTLTVIKNGCTVTKTKTVVVKRKPDISFEDVNANSANQFSNCASTTNLATYSITVGNTSASASCISSYSIDWGDNTTSSNVIFPVTHIYTSRGVFNMIITALGSNDCSNSVTYVVKNISNPSGGILSPGGTSDMCLPSPVIQYSIGNWALNSPGTTYTVNYGDNIAGSTIILSQNDMVNTSYYNATNPSSSANYPVPYSYTTVSCPATDFIITLVVTNACKSTTGTVVGGNTIKKPTANFTAPVKSCISTNVLFINETILGFDTGCVRDTKFTWNFGDPGSGASNIIGETSWLTTTPNVNHTFSAPGIYTVTLSARNGCGTTIKTQQICIEPPLTPQFTLNTILGCAPLAITATNTTILTNQCSTPTYKWEVTHAAGFCSTTPFMAL